MSLYDIKVKSASLNSGAFPPALDIELSVQNNTEETFPVLLYFSIFFQSSEHNFTFWDTLSPAPGRISVSRKLVPDHLKFLNAKEQLGQANGININIRANLVSEGGGTLAEHSVSVSVDKDKWVLAQQEDNKPKPDGLRSYHHFMVDVDRKIAELEKRTASDPLFRLQTDIFHKQVEMIQNYIIEQPVMKNLFLFKPAMDITKAMQVDIKWAVGAAILSSSEGYIKKWLVKHAGESLSSLKRLEFNALIEKMRAQFRKDGISVDQTIFSNMSGQRDYRNLVLHEMHEPNESELATITKQITDFLQYVESKKPLF